MYRYQCMDCRRNLYLEELKPAREIRCPSLDCLGGEMRVGEEHAFELLEQQDDFPGKVDLQVIRDKWDMPFLEKNMIVKVKGKLGHLVCGFEKGNIKGNIIVRMDDTSQRLMCHPQWEISYFDHNSELIKEYTAKTKES